MTTVAVLLVAIALLGLVIATLSTRLRDLPLSEPLLALVVGVLLGPAVTGAIDLPPVTQRSHEMHELSQVLLAVSVMAVALRYPVREAWQVRGPVTWLIVIVMPVMAAAAALLAWPLGLSLAAAVALGCALCPTDPVLVFTIVLSLGVLGAAELLQVGGVLAVFVAGLALNASSPGDDRADAVVLDEAMNRFVLLPGFILLGAVLPWSAWGDLGPGLLLVVVGVLLLRRLPWLLLLRRPLRLPWADALFLGWFGPIGVSAIFYLSLLAERMSHDEAVPILAIGTAVVAASTVVHGVTSAPLRQLYARRTAGADESR